ncbi:MAG TPA: O-antigen ligase family protein [Pyrinomonadaceae bacterium]|nr:O-antigen ligase family protein [Pyrinomonadaceae bacterium]
MKQEPQPKSQAAKILDAAILVFLFVFAAAAPNSIAATQSAWLIGMALWLARSAIQPRRKLFRTPVDYFVLGFFILTGLSSFVSYEPMVSIGKLRAASLFTIIYLFVENIPSLRIARLLALTLISACMVNVVYTAGERLLGRAVQVHGVSTNSPLYQAGIRDGDTLLKVDGQKLEDPQDLLDALLTPNKELGRHAKDSVAVLTYRHELLPVFKIPRGAVLPGNNPVEQLGIGSWTRGRDWRATGFYGQFVTYSEALQLIIALVLGIFVSLPVKRSWIGALLLVGLAGMGGALLLTVTRASWLGCLVSTLIVLLLGVGRRALIVIGLLAIPLVLAGLFVLQQKRNVAFIDQTDQSTTWRETVWREGVNLLVSKPRHLLVGVGMDSIKAHWRQWGMFDNGKIPWGHMHSNLLQIALERGVPALIIWLAFLFTYARTLWRALHRGSQLDWIERGILLGALGGLVGFFTSGLVHYNWGDSEVAMIFYLVMGLALAIYRHSNGTATIPH